MKNLLKIIGNCNEVKGRLKQKIALLINNDLLLVDGKQDEIIGRLQAKMGKTRHEVMHYIAAQL